MLTTPESIHQELSRAINSADIDSIVSLYEEDASLTRHDGQTLVGHIAIRAHFVALLELNPTIVIEPALVIANAGCPTLIANWRLTGTSPTGEVINEEGCTYDMVRQQADGTWRLFFDNPWGGAGDWE